MGKGTETPLRLVEVHSVLALEKQSKGLKECMRQLKIIETKYVATDKL